MSESTLKSNESGNISLKESVNKQRLTKKKSKKSSIKSNQAYVVKAYCTADYYDLELLEEAIKKSGAYEIIDHVAREIPDSCLVARAKYPELNETEPRYLFFFEDGATVLWNVNMKCYFFYNYFYLN